MKKHKGNYKAQRKRRRKRLKNSVVKKEKNYELIDGNISFRAVAECKHYNGYLTEGLIETHRCRERNCSALIIFDSENKINTNSPIN